MLPQVLVITARRSSLAHTALYRESRGNTNGLPISACQVAILFGMGYNRRVISKRR